MKSLNRSDRPRDPLDPAKQTPALGRSTRRPSRQDPGYTTRRRAAGRLFVPDKTPEPGRAASCPTCLSVGGLTSAALPLRPPRQPIVHELLFVQLRGRPAWQWWVDVGGSPASSSSTSVAFVNTPVRAWNGIMSFAGGLLGRVREESSHVGGLLGYRGTLAPSPKSGAYLSLFPTSMALRQGNRQIDIPRRIRTSMLV